MDQAQNPSARFDRQALRKRGRTADTHCERPQTNAREGWNRSVDRARYHRSFHGFKSYAVAWHRHEPRSPCHLPIGIYCTCMRRLLPISAFALFLALPLWAQHGGGPAGGGHGGGFGGHAGFSGSHGGGFSGSHGGGFSGSDGGGFSGSHGGGFSGSHSGGGHVGGMRSGPVASRGFAHGPSFSQ